MDNKGLMEFDIQDFLWNGILKESEFRKKLEEHDWSQYDNRKVIIKGCGSTPIPTWAYMVVTAYLVQHAEKVMYGEACSAVPIFRRTKASATTDINSTT
ncbi:MAG: DUF2480 family protein [Chloroherpetonaceae bacterium]|nr:DUF2480 family protein [Chloroherpetonaceae bacterium]MCS7212335.1 DUF2480 family protein [Chloroherpetonaceae bacterium]MDW8019406.1 DUF2480 family protein [Chloroherpetonaceae bacterium]